MRQPKIHRGSEQGFVLIAKIGGLAAFVDLVGERQYGDTARDAEVQLVGGSAPGSDLAARVQGLGEMGRLDPAVERGQEAGGQSSAEEVVGLELEAAVRTDVERQALKLRFGSGGVTLFRSAFIVIRTARAHERAGSALPPIFTTAWRSSGM
jgi:hypothetical protein